MEWEVQTVSSASFASSGCVLGFLVFEMVSVANGISTSFQSKVLNSPKDLRHRSGAYPFELAFRLINMYSVKGDTVLDPFLGTGTTTLASIASERNSIGVELDSNFSSLLDERILKSKHLLNEFVTERLNRHCEFITVRSEDGKPPGYVNGPHGFGVVTRQEREACIRLIDSIENQNGDYDVVYTPTPLRFDEEVGSVRQTTTPEASLLAYLT